MGAYLHGGICLGLDVDPSRWQSGSMTGWGSRGAKSEPPEDALAWIVEQFCHEGFAMDNYQHSQDEQGVHRWDVKKELLAPKKIIQFLEWDQNLLGNDLLHSDSIKEMSCLQTAAEVLTYIGKQEWGDDIHIVDSSDGFGNFQLRKKGVGGYYVNVRIMMFHHSGKVGGESDDYLTYVDRLFRLLAICYPLAGCVRFFIE